MTQQQEKGVRGIFDQNPNDFRDCMLIHQYANLQVTDSLIHQDADRWKLVRGDGEAKDGEDQEETVDVMVRPGAVYDAETGSGNELHVGVNMFVMLEGISNPVQVLPTGPIAKWTSKGTVPIAGFLCMTQGESDSSPVLHSLPTPCIPTSLDEVGNALDPTIDDYEVWIGTTRVTFDTVEKAETFCYGLAETISTDMSTQVWDADQFQTLNISGIFATESEGKFIVPKNETDLIKEVDKPAGLTMLSKRSTVSSNMETNTFAVAITRAPGQQLGLDVVDIGSALKIVGVYEGPVKRWNAANADSYVQTGDRIVGVNGVIGNPEKLAGLLKNSSSMTLLITRQAVFAIKDIVSIDGRQGVVTWDGRPKNMYVMVKWLDDGSKSDVIPVDKVQLVPKVQPARQDTASRTPEELLESTEEYMASGGKAR